MKNVRNMPTTQDRMETLMAVKRIVPNIASDQLDKAKSFYAEILDMDVVMDLGWIVTFAAAASANPQVSVAAEGGSGTPVPDLSVEVDNFDEVLLRVRRSSLPIVYGPAQEPWGVQRFFVRDPFGRLLNILAH
jgi:catechol 2,3-dioxygenase-like lactoylglutathione lyase family enzyme